MGRPAARSGGSIAAGLAVAAAWLLVSACASYDERLLDAHRAFYRGDLQLAEEALRAQLDDGGRHADRPVLQLELASVLQAQERYREAAALLVRTDDQLEVLDYSTDAVRDVADFAFAPGTRTYKASPPERVMLYAQNMLNFLAQGRPGEAAVEARRLRLLLTMEDIPQEELFSNPFAWALAGLSFELAGDRAEAVDAWRAAGEAPLRTAVALQLPGGGEAQASGAGEHETATVPATAGDAALPASGVLADAGPEARRPRRVQVPGAAGQRAGEAALPGVPRHERPGEVLVVVQTGKAPLRRPALVLLPVAGRLHRLDIPTLVSRPSAFDAARVSVGGVEVGEVPLAFHLGAHVRRRFDQEFPRLVAAAVTQVLPRAVTAEAVRRGVEKESESPALAFLAGFLSEWVLAELAVPDTRCWTLLPEQVHALRVALPPGRHELLVTLTGRQHRVVRREVDVQPGRLAVLNVVTGPLEGYAPVPSPERRDLRDAPEGEQALRALEATLIIGSAIAH